MEETGARRGFTVRGASLNLKISGRRILRPRRVGTMKKILGLVGILAIVGAVVAFFRREADDDEFLDEELQ